MNSHLVFDRIPDSVRSQALALGLTDAECVFSVRSDLALDGASLEVWMILTKTALLSLSPGPRSGSSAQTGPFPLSDIDKVRSFQTVGSAFLQCLIDGVYVDVLRYSNARRELMERARIQIERVLAGELLQKDMLTRPSELICAKCGLPLSDSSAQCYRCQSGRGLLFRSLALMKPFWLFLVLLVVMMLAGVGMDLVPPYLTRMLVDRVLVPKQNLHWLPIILLGLVGTSLIRYTLTIFIGRVSSLVGTRMTRELRERLVRKLLNLSMDYYSRHPAGNLMSRVVYDVDQFQSFVAQVAQGFVLNLMLVIGIGVMLFSMNPRLAALVLLPIPFVVIGTTFFWKHVYPRYYRLWDSQSKMSGLLSGLMHGIRLVKSFGQEEREHRRFSNTAQYMQNTRRTVDMSLATFNPIMGFIFGLGTFIIWYAGGHFVINDTISLGTLMAFFGYMAMFYSPISALSMFSNWLTGFLSAAQRIFEILDSHTSITEVTTPVRLPTLAGAIEFRNVTFGYDPYTPVLKNVSFRIEPGQFVGVVGKSGCGKTTLVNLICRFYDANQGEVLIDGHNVKKVSLDDLHQQIGLVLQDPFLFRASVAENITYGRPNAAIPAILNAAKLANAHDFIARRAAAYDTKLGELGAGLSGGERQRISIARALLCEPRILILDEATSSVDTESEQEIQRALASVCRGRTTIAIAHRLSTLKNADHIFVVDEGRIVETGTHEELLALKGIYNRLVRIQTELTRLEVT